MLPTHYLVWEHNTTFLEYIEGEVSASRRWQFWPFNPFIFLFIFFLRKNWNLWIKSHGHYYCNDLNLQKWVNFPRRFSRMIKYCDLARVWVLNNNQSFLCNIHNVLPMCSNAKFTITQKSVEAHNNTVLAQEKKIPTKQFTSGWGSHSIMNLNRTIKIIQK